MRVAIIDADLIGRKNHKFPNLASMKLSGYYKEFADTVDLKLDYEGLDSYDKVLISKAFTDTPVPDYVLNMKNVKYGGTGFNYDNAVPLMPEIEHHKPDYHLYDEFVAEKIKQGFKPVLFRYYTDYSIGFTTRGCFRKCQFCVNRNYSSVQKHSPLSEFLDDSRKKICLLDDNVLGCRDWEQILKELQASGKRFQFKQGLDIRLLDEKKCEVLFHSKYDGEYIFAFDDISEYSLIERKLKLLRKYTKKTVKVYVFCAYDRNGVWDNDFWRHDIFGTFKRIELLIHQNCIPYIMRYEKYTASPYKGMYINIASWCNIVRVLKTFTFREFCIKNGIGLSRYRYMVDFEKQFPEVSKYFDMRFEPYSNLEQGSERSRING